MRAELLRNALRDLYKVRRTVCIEGPPGIGKTSIVEQVAAELGVPFIARHLPTIPAEDFGVPWPHGEVLTYKLPDWFPAAGRVEPNGILLFDDRNQASADLQKIMANICQARNLHGVPLAEGWMVISTGNRQSDRAGANRVLSHLRNRETVLELEVNLDDYSAWALQNGIDASLISFFRYRPALLNDFDSNREINPTCRSWSEGVAPFIGKVNPDIEYDIYRGAVGDGAAAEFLGFMKIVRKLPNPDLILMDPMNAAVPEDPATLYAITGAVSHRMTQNNIGNAIKYLQRLPGEFLVLGVSLAVKRDHMLCNTNEFADFASRNNKLLF